MKKLIASLLFVPCIASAEFFTGNQLLEKLTSPSVNVQMQALGYVQGVADVYMYVTFCPPNGITAGQLEDLSRSYLQNNPAIRNKTAESLLNQAFKQIWPCPQQPRRGA